MHAAGLCLTVYSILHGWSTRLPDDLGAWSKLRPVCFVPYLVYYYLNKGKVKVRGLTVSLSIPPTA
jgi:hypothetical protein